MTQLLLSITPQPELLAKLTKNLARPKVVGLFAGCGGLDYGFKQAGFEVVYANDFEPSVRETYERNVGPIHIGDIRQVNKADIPECDVLLAGIPCQPFSNAGNRQSVEDERGNLFTQVMLTIRVKKPKVVLFENVKGFLSAKDGNGLVMPERIKAELKKVGYTTFYQLLNASDYEVPQNRERVVIVGVRSDLKRPYDFPQPISKTDELLIGSVLAKALPKGEVQEVWDLSPQSVEIARYITEGGSWKQVPYEKLPPRLKNIRDNIKKYRSPNFYRRFSRDEIMGTITAAATPENSGIIHPLELRRYSVREIARFQSFPDSFKFIGASTPNKYKMIGNAVPVKLAYWLGLSIKYHLFRSN